MGDTLVPTFGDSVCGKQSPGIRHSYLRQVLRRASDLFPDQDLKILEIGSWVGASAVTWATELTAYRQGRGLVHCVDPWMAYFDENVDKGDHYSKMNEVANSGLAYNTFLRNIKASDVESV